MSAQTLCNPSASGLDGHLSQGQPLLPGTHSASNSAEGIHPLPAKQITPPFPASGNGINQTQALRMDYSQYYSRANEISNSARPGNRPVTNALGRGEF